MPSAQKGKGKETVKKSFGVLELKKENKENNIPRLSKKKFFYFLVIKKYRDFCFVLKSFKHKIHRL